MKRWIVTYTDKDESRYASSHVCQAESIRGAVAQFEKGNFSVVSLIEYLHYCISYFYKFGMLDADINLLVLSSTFICTQ